MSTPANKPAAPAPQKPAAPAPQKPAAPAPQKPVAAHEVDEWGRPPRPARGSNLAIFKEKKLAYFRVTETQLQRNEGRSIVRELEEDGWWKPTDKALLQPSPDGNSFYMVRPQVEVDADTQRNNNRARLMENIKDHPNVKEKTKKVTQYSGEEIVQRMKSTGDTEHDS